MHRRVPLLFTLGLLVSSGCSNGNSFAQSDALRSRIGRNCDVQIRPDWLGTSNELPISVGTDGVNGAKVSVSGKLAEVDENWIVLRDGDPGTQETIIPRDAVLHIQVAAN